MLLNQINTLHMSKTEIIEEVRTVGEGKRVLLGDGSLSPVLSSLLSSLPESFVGALSYDQIVVLNGAAAKLTKAERLKDFDLLSQLFPNLIPDLFSSLSPWLIINAYRLRHKELFGITMRIALVIKIRGLATVENIRNSLNINAVFITMSAMRMDGIIERSDKKVKIHNKSYFCFKLTPKGHKFVNLALKALERRESLLFQNISK